MLLPLRIFTRLIYLLVFAFVCTRGTPLARAALPADIPWTNAAGGIFDVAGNWTGSVVPGTIDTADFNLNATYTVTFVDTVSTGELVVHKGNVTFDLTMGNQYTLTASQAVNPFIVGAVSGDNATLTLTDNSDLNTLLNGTFYAAIGQNAGSAGTVIVTGSANWQTNTAIHVGDAGAGTLSVFPSSNIIFGGTQNLYFGFASTGVGTGLQQGGNVTVSGSEFIGLDGHGSFVHSAGNHVVDTQLIIGNHNASVGSYDLQGGNLTVGNSLTVGLNSGSTGTFTQEGGTAQVGFNMIVANDAGSTGTFTSSGNMTLDNFLYIGGNTSTPGGSGIVNLNGANVSVLGGGIKVFDTGTTSLNITGGTLLHTTALNLLAASRINWTGGSLFITNTDLSVDPTPILSGSSWIGGTLAITPGKSLILSKNLNLGMTTPAGTASITQTGGTVSVLLNTLISSGVTAGTYSLQGGTLSATNVYVGGSSTAIGTTGTFNISGGNATLTGVLKIWNAGSSAVALSGGSLTAQSIDFSGVPSRFSWTGGELHLVGQALDFANAADPLALLGNSLALNNSKSLLADGGEFFVATSSATQSGGTNTPASLTLNGSSVSYSLTGGTLSVSGTESIGHATFTHSAGNNTAAGLLLGAGGAATYNLSGTAQLFVSGDESFGPSGAGTLTQTGGSNSMAGNLFLGGGAGGGTGTYTLTSGTLSVGNGLTLGNPSAGVLTVNSAGTATIAGTLTIANVGGNSLNLSGGSLSAHDINLNGNPGLFNWTSGKFTITSNNVTWDPSLPNTTSGAFGSSLTLGAGKTLITNGSETLGGAAPFTMTISGGSHTVFGVLAINADSKLTFSSGSLSPAGLNTNGNPANFAWTGGTLTLASISFDPNASSTSTSAAFGSSLTLAANQILNVTGNETIGGTSATGTPFNLFLTAGANTVSGTITLNLLGSLLPDFGTLNYNAFVMNGGTIFGTIFTIPSNATFSYNSGNFNIEFANNGTANLNANFTTGPGGFNSGSLNIASGVTATFNNIGLFNSGTTTLNNSFLSAAAFQNDGLLTGPGSITITTPSGLFNSDGNIILNSGTLTVTSSALGINSGNIQLAAGATLQLRTLQFDSIGIINLNGGALIGNTTFLNDIQGLIIGPGTINMALTNTGTISLSGGLLNLPAFTNAGLIQLSGNTASILSQGILTNNNSIEGFGRLGAVTTNNATIEAIGGTLTIANALTNASTGILRATPGTKILLLANNFPANAGLIDLAGGTFDNGGGPLDNTGQISGFGILATGLLTNDGAITFTGGTTTINGPVINSATRTITLKNQPALFTGPVTNNGTIKTTSTVATFAGGYSGSGAFISDPSTNIFSAAVSIGSGGTMTGGAGDQFIMSSGAFTNNGNFNNGGLLQSSDPTTNNSTFTQSGPQSWGINTPFTNSAGTATFLSDTGSPASSPLLFATNSGTVNFSSSQHINTLAINGGATNILSGVTKLSTLTLAHSGPTFSGKLDLTTGKLILQSSSPADKAAKIADLNAAITAGSNGITWSGDGITSSAAAGDPLHYGVGVFDNAILGLSSFGDPGSVDANSILVAVAHLGDANRNNIVDIQDLTIVANNWQQPRNNWAQGDLNRDGIVDIQDFTIVANNWQQTSSFPLDPLIIQPTTQAPTLQQNTAAAPPQSAVTIPEPATLPLLALSVLLLRRNKQRSPALRC